MEYNTEDYRNIAITISVVISPLIALIGWWVQAKIQRRNNKQIKEKELEILLRQKDIERLETQISDYYAPIYSIRKQTEAAHMVYRSYMPKSINNEGKEIIEVDKMRKDFEWVIHDFIVFNYLLPFNREIMEIIKQKSHLLKNDEFDLQLNKFLAHSIEFEIIKKLQTSEKLPVEIRQGTFPEEFTEIIEKRLNELRKKYLHLIGESKTTTE